MTKNETCAKERNLGKYRKQKIRGKNMFFLYTNYMIVIIKEQNYNPISILLNDEMTGSVPLN